MGVYVHEVLEKAAAAKTKEEKVDILKKGDSFALRTILQGAMDSSIEFILPEGPPPFSSEDAGKWGYTSSAIQRAAKKFRFFVKGGPGETLKAPRREKMFIDLLESMHPKDAELLILMKDKALIKKTGTAHYKGITKQLVLVAFPSLFKE